MSSNRPGAMPSTLVVYHLCGSSWQRQGFGVGAQRDVIDAAFEGGNVQVLASYRDMDTTRSKRVGWPGLRQAIQRAAIENATLVIARLDCFPTRSPLASALSRINFVSCDHPQDSYHHLRRRLRRRAAPYMPSPAPRARRDKYRDVESAKAAARLAEISALLAQLDPSGDLRALELARALNDRGILAARGGSWTVQAVTNLRRKLKGNEFTPVQVQDSRADKPI